MFMEEFILKKRIVAVLLCMSMAMSMTTGCGSTAKTTDTKTKTETTSDADNEKEKSEQNSASAKAKNIARLLSIDLPYSGNDTLEEVMLDQLKKENINKSEYIPALQQCADKSPSDAIHIVYFSGHGGHSYII